MKEFVRRDRRCSSSVAAVVIVLGLVADVAAYPPRRGPMYNAQPTPVDSSEMIDGLKKALKALDEVEGDYDGHREKAIKHIHAAVRDLASPNAKGKGNANAAVSGKPRSKDAARSQTDAEADVSLQKALKSLFSVHHRLTDKASTRGRIHADAQVRIAIQELVDARKITAPAAKPAAKPVAKSAGTPAPSSSFTTRPSR